MGKVADLINRRKQPIVLKVKPVDEVKVYSWSLTEDRILWKLRDERILVLACFFNRHPSEIISNLKRLEFVYSIKSAHTKTIYKLNRLRNR